MPGPTYDQAVAALTERLSGPALRHSLATGEEAARLAVLYGVDPETARLAGVLHDWAREESAEELLRRASEAGVEISEVDRCVPYLLHGPVGALQVQETFPGISENAVHAIARHTMGSRSMTPLDLVVYLADMLEPGRCYPEVDDLRALVGVASLRDLFGEAYAASIRHLVGRRKRIHPATVEAWNAIVAGEC